MNKIIRTLLFLASTGLITGAALAQPAFKPVVVDMAKVFENHYKTEEAFAKLNETGQKVQEQLEQMGKLMQGKADQYQELMEQSNNTVLKLEARAQAKADAQKIAEELQRMEQEAQNFRSKQNSQIQQRVKTHRDLLYEEISRIAVEIAKAKGATLVLDKSASPVTGFPNIIYSDESYDITEEVLKLANKDRPPAPPAPAVAPATTPTTTTPEPAK